MAKSEEFKYEIVEHIEDLNEKNDKGWVKQLNLVKWGDAKEALYDIRNWQYDENGTPVRCGKGITLQYDELALLGQSLYDKGIC